MTAPPTPAHEIPTRGGPRLLCAVLRQRDDVGPRTCLLRFELSQPLRARPGQFVMLRAADWGSAPLLPRPMSLLSAGLEVSMLVKVVGEGTRRLASAALGSSFTLLGPLGAPWVLPGAGERAVLVAGGVGLPPLLFLAREIGASAPDAKGDRARPFLLYGGRTAADLPLTAEAQQSTELRVATEDGSRGTPGLVTALLEPALAEIARDGARARLYACGPEPMMRAVAAKAAAHDVGCQVSLEARMACGYGVCLGCAVPRASGGYLYACTDGPCVDSREIEWTDTEHRP